MSARIQKGGIKMSDNKLKELLKKLDKDPEARKKVEDLAKPADEKVSLRIIRRWQSAWR